MKKSDITVISGIRTAGGFRQMSELTPEERKKAGQQLMVKYLNAMFAGEAEFRAGS